MTIQAKRTVFYIFSGVLVVGIAFAVWFYRFINTSSPATVQTATLFQTTVQTTDHAFALSLTVTPKSVGTNTFVVHVRDTATNDIRTNVGVDLYATNADMDMGTTIVHLRQDGVDAFSARNDLTMDGHWKIRLEVRTRQNTLHYADTSFQVLT